MTSSATVDKKVRVLILGGGFGGMYAALEMEKHLARKASVQVTMVDQQNYFLFTPMLHEVAASDLDITDIVSPNRELLKRVQFFQGMVTAIDLPNKKVSIAHCNGKEECDFEFDHLLLALGSNPNYFNMPGLQEHSMTMQTLRDAIYLRNAMIESLEEAELDAFAGKQEPLLTYVVAGGGFAGVETVAAMNDFLRESIRFYPHLKEEMLRIVLVHDEAEILPELGAELGKYAREKLSQRKVEINLKHKVTGYSDQGVEIEGTPAIKPVIFVWTAGMSANKLMRTLPCKIERGKVVTNEYMEVPEWPGVWATGDCAWIPNPKTGKSYPPTAQHASREGVVVAKNIAASILGGTKQKFEFGELGALASIGRRTGVAKILGHKFSGLFAWILWRTVYLGKLPRFEKKLRVALNWTLEIMFPKDLVQFMTLHAPLTQNEETANIVTKSAEKSDATVQGGTHT